MLNDPRLASRILPVGHPQNYARVPLSFTVNGGLNYLKGNGAPYFSLTCWAHRSGFPDQCQGGGADHEKILALYPQFADLAALHLRDIDGAPMHAEANGWYQLAGALGGMGERYHSGHSQRHYPRAVLDPAKPRQTTEYRSPTPAEAMQHFADFIRLPLDAAQRIAESVHAYTPRDYKAARAEWARIMETMRPRWKREAEACIAHHNLVIYGDRIAARYYTEVARIIRERAQHNATDPNYAEGWLNKPKGD